MAKRIVNCPVCYSAISLKEKDPDPAACPACGTDWTNPAAESPASQVPCQYLKGAFVQGTGLLCMTNQRLFWLKQVDRDSSNPLVAAVFSAGAGKAPLSLPLGEIERAEEYRRFFNKGVAVITKSGEKHAFVSENPQELQSLLAPYMAG